MMDSTRFAHLYCILKKHFHDPDLQMIRIVMGTLKAHYLRIGDPAWLFVVAPPGSGKTTMGILTTSNLKEVVTLSDFTENTLLSGFAGRTTPGLLEKLGTTKQDGQTFTTVGQGILLAKDFTTVLSMRREKRAAIMGQLRELHDGEFKRCFGTGETKIFRGRISIVAAVTPALDRHYSVFSTLGERFLQVRSHRPDPEAGEWAIRQQGKESTIQAESSAAIKDLFDGSTLVPPGLSDDMTVRLASIAEVVAFGRTPIHRSSYGAREIEDVPEPEANTRLSKGLAAVVKGIAALNGRAQVAENDLQDGFRVALDCLPKHRRTLLLDAWKGTDLGLVAMPRTVREREIEELRELGVLDTTGTRLSDNFMDLMKRAGVTLP